MTAVLVFDEVVFILPLHCVGDYNMYRSQFGWHYVIYTQFAFVVITVRGRIAIGRTDGVFCLSESVSYKMP